jgi:hypothetical protein
MMKTGLCFSRPLAEACAKTEWQARRETPVTLKWIAERLRMGTWTHVENRLYHMTK